MFCPKAPGGVARENVRMAGGCHCNLNFNSSKDHTTPVAVWVIPKGAAVSDAAELDGLLGSAFFLHCRNRAVLAKPLAFCNLREEASISCLGYAGAHPCGFLSSDICPSAPPPSVYLLSASRLHHLHILHSRIGRLCLPHSFIRSFYY